MKFNEKMRPVGRETNEWKNTPTDAENLKVTDKRGNTFHPHAKDMDLRPGLNYAHRHK
jgi:hypothetical protein